MVAEVASQAHEVFRELASDVAHFGRRVAAQRFRSLFHATERQLARRELLDDLLHLLHVVAVHQGALQMLQVNRRAVVEVQIADFVAGQHVQHHPVLVQAADPGVEQPLAGLRARAEARLFPARVEQPLRVGRLVQEVAQAAAISLCQELKPALALFQLRRHLLEFLFQELVAAFDVGQFRLHLRRIAAAADAGEEPFAAFQTAGKRVALGFQLGQLRAGGQHLGRKLFVGARRRGKLLALRLREHGIAQELEQQRFVGLKAVLIAHKIAEQDVMLQMDHIVPSALDEQQAVLQQAVGLREVVAKQRTAQACQDGVFELGENLIDLLPDGAVDVAAVGLEFIQARAEDIGLLAAVKMFPA
jgi:hypothetical protein